jgi:hypothetical protein
MARMKAVVLILGLLAAGKVAMHEYLYRSGTREVLVNAYRDRAILACQKDPRNQGLVINPAGWSRPVDIRVVVGRSDLDVWIWQIDHALWSARFRNPYLQLTGADRQAGVQCDYDIVHGVASVSRS